MLEGGDVILLIDFIERYIPVMPNHVIGDLPMEKGIVGKNEHLLDVCTLVFVILQSDVITANAQHLPDKRTHNK